MSIRLGLSQILHRFLFSESFLVSFDSLIGVLYVRQKTYITHINLKSWDLTTKSRNRHIDTCFWCRPFDDQTTHRIQEETQALHKLLELVDTGHIELIRSPFVHFELSFIDDYEKRVQIEKLIMDSGTFVTIPPHTQTFAKKIRHECHVNGLDALHVACAINLEIEIFLMR
jgi:hypothetical protein